MPIIWISPENIPMGLLVNAYKRFRDLSLNDACKALQGEDYDLYAYLWRNSVYRYGSELIAYQSPYIRHIYPQIVAMAEGAIG